MQTMTTPATPAATPEPTDRASKLRDIAALRAEYIAEFNNTRRSDTDWCTGVGEVAVGLAEQVPWLTAEIDRLSREVAQVRALCATVIEVHDHVVMDTEADRELHDRAVTTFRDRLAALTAATETANATDPGDEPDLFEYRVAYRHYDGTVVEWGSGLGEEAARRDAARGNQGDREFWVERRPIVWERIA